MATKVGDAFVEISARDTQLAKGLADAQSKTEKSMSAISTKMASVGKTVTIAGAAITAAFGLTVKAAIDFNKEVANIATLIPGSTKRVDELKSAIRDMAVTVGKDTADLAQGAYQVISAWGDTADTVGILGIAAKAATAGVATTTDAIDLLSAVTKGYGDTSSEAVQKVSDLAFQTVTLGQTTFPELAGSIGKVTPLAASLGLGMDELFAVMATGTGVTGKAAEVSTQLRGIMQSLMAPTKDMTDLLEEKGYASGEAMLADLGLAGALELITGKVEETGLPLQKFIGSIEGQTLALALTGTQADTYIEKLAAMKESTGLTDIAFKEQTEGVNAAGFAFQQAKIQIGVMAQEIGDKLLPMLVPLIQKVTEVIGKISEWAKENPKLFGTIIKVAAVIGALAAVGGPILMAISAFSAISGVIGAFAAIATGPIGLVIAAIALLTLAWKTNFGGIQEKTKAVTDFIKGLLDKFMDFVGKSFDRLDKVIRTVKNWADKTVRFIKDLKTIAGREIEKLIGGIIDTFSDLANLPKKMLEWGKNAISGFVDGMKGAMENVTNAVTGVADKIKNFLGFKSPPAEGPLSGSDKWMPNMMSMFGTGITGNINKIMTPITSLTESMENEFTTAIDNAVLSVSDGLGDMAATIGDITSDIITPTETLTGKFLDVWDTLKTDFKTNIVDPIVGYLENNLTYAISGLLGGIEDFEWSWSDFWTGLKNVLINAVAAMIAKLIVLQGLLLFFPWLAPFLSFSKGGGITGYEKGGKVKSFASGGGTDTVPAMLTPGEYVIAKPMVDFIKQTGSITGGLIDAIKTGARTPMAFAGGGGVSSSSYDNRKNYTSSIQIMPGAINIVTPKFSSADGQELFRQLERQIKMRGLKLVRV